MLRNKELMALVCSLTIISSALPLSTAAVEGIAASGDIIESDRFNDTTTVVIWYSNIEHLKSNR